MQTNSMLGPFVNEIFHLVNIKIVRGRHVCSYGIEFSPGHLENAIILIDQSK